MGNHPRKADGRRVFSAEFKRTTVQRILTGEKTMAELSRELDIAPSVIRNWARRSEVELPRFRGRCTAFALRDDWVSLFIADRRLVVQAGMPPVRVVPALDEVEDGHAGLGLGREAAAIEQLTLERGEEALAEGVVVGVAHVAHGGPDAGFAAAEAKGDRGVLREFNWSSQLSPCEPIVGPRRAPRPVFASRGSFAA